MANMQINARLNLDTSQATNEMRNFQNAVGARGASGSSSDIIPSSTNSINNSLEQRDIQKQTMEIMSQLLFAVQQNTLAVQGRNNGSFGGSGNGREGTDLKGFTDKVLAGITLGSGVYSGVVAYQTSQRRAQIMKENADPYGAQIETLQGRNNSVNSFTSVLPMVGSIVGALAGPMGIAIGSFTGKALQDLINTASSTMTESQISKIEERQNRTEKYRKDLSLMDKSLMSFGYSNTAAGNRTLSLDMWNQAVAGSEGTGLDTSTYMGIAQGFGRYGVSKFDTANRMARNAGLVARFTNTDVNDISRYLGTQYRYGNANGIDNLNYAYSSALASGLNKDQFGEFLTGLQSVIEEGISNGYEKNSDEISKTTLMLSSVNKNWTGENAFIRYNKMDSGLRNATNLSTPEQMLAFSALRSSGMSSLDVMKTLEKGLTVDTFSTISAAMNQQYGGSDLSLATAYRKLFGLSYNDADQVAQWSRTGTITQAQINSLGKGKANVDVQTDYSQLQGKINQITASSEIIGAAQWTDYFSDVKKIATELSNSKNLKDAKVDTGLSDSYKVADGSSAGQKLRNTLIQAGFVYDSLESTDFSTKMSTFGNKTLKSKWADFSSDDKITKTEMSELIKILKDIYTDPKKQQAIFVQ